MSSRPTQWSDPEGPFRADHIRDGDHYELSNGHAIHCMTAGTRHGTAHSAGHLVVMTAAVAPEQTGIDVGVAWNDGKNLRAPDLSLGLDPNRTGWAGAAPPLAIEYASSGQDEATLEAKIAELLEFGTRTIWVVRLTGPLRVEIHEPGVPMRLVDADGTLSAPGILARDVPVRALIDPAIAVETALHNLLAQKGYRDLDAVRDEAREEGREEGRLDQTRNILQVQLTARGFTIPPALGQRITACTDLLTLMRWLSQVAGAPDVEAALR